MNQNEEKQEMQEMNKPYEKKIYFALTLDPVGSVSHKKTALHQVTIENHY